MTFPNLDVHSLQLMHGVSLRVGGVSPLPYYSLNLGLHVGDEPGHVVRNRRLLCEGIGVELDSLVVGEQVHGCDVRIVTAADGGRGSRSLDDVVAGVDGFVTAIPGVVLMVLVADCPAIILYDPRCRVLGLVHAGWRGTLSRIIQAALAKMTEEYGVFSSTVVAAISPAVGPCCYTVSAERAASFLSTFRDYGSGYIIHDKAGQAHLDLGELNRLQLVESGVPPDAVCVSGLCTSCHTGMFFSYRREHARTGRFGVVAGLRAGE